jgi:iron complex transport system substrate-binding protein
MLSGMPNAVRSLVFFTVLATVAVACGGDDDSADAGGGGDDTGFTPVEVEHALGTTTVDEAPERVVALGPADLDAALALGVEVVGAASTGSGEGVTPWSVDAGGEQAYEVLSVSGDALQVDLEEVAALEPDLILAATYYDIDAAYDQLSEIAPTTAYQEGPVTDTWQQVTGQVGQALGRADDATALVDEVEAAVDGLATDHPDAAGTTFTFGFVTLDAVSTLRAPGDVMMTVPTGLGMTLSDAVLALPEGESFAVPVGLEQLDVLDADVLALYDAGDSEARSAVESSPLWATLPVVERGAVVDLDDDQFFALRQPTALSIPWVIEAVVPALVEAATS